MLFKNPPLTGLAGRPRSTHCKRGHERRRGEVSCGECRRLRDQWKYASDPAFRTKRVEYQRGWRADFTATHGYGASTVS